MFSRLHPRPSLRSRRAATALVGLASTIGLVAGLALAVPEAAVAAAPGPHDPIGKVTAVKAVPGGIAVTGWTFDPDARTSTTNAWALVDGLTRVTVRTAVANPVIAARYKTSPTPGFTMTVPVATGSHTVCVGGTNIKSGKNTVFWCVALPLGTKLTSAQLAKHNPKGVVSSATASATSVHLTGFTTDPDYLNKHFEVVLYLDGRAVLTKGTSATRAGAPKGSGRFASFDLVQPVTTGTHMACVWAVNIGFGSNSFLGCNALDTRAGQAIAKGSPSTAINAKVLAEAKKHIGQPYVWGAIGPKKFDCSGLVMYSYKKQGFVTPRVSEDQAKAARLIPASRAIPGDLVFYHDTQGDVYHVGIYQGPLQTVAAIDEAEGVNYQHIWDPSTATYGSFTHV